MDLNTSPSSPSTGVSIISDKSRSATRTYGFYCILKRVISGISLQSILLMLFTGWNLLYFFNSGAPWLWWVSIGIIMPLMLFLPAIFNQLRKFLLLLYFFAFTIISLFFVQSDYKFFYIITGLSMFLFRWISNLSDDKPLLRITFPKQFIMPIFLFLYFYGFWNITHKLYLSSTDLQASWILLWANYMPSLNYDALAKIPFLPVSVTLFTGCTILLTWAKNTPYPNWNAYTINRLGLAHTYMMTALSLLCILLFSMTTGSYRISLLCLISLLLLDTTILLFAHTMPEDFVRKQVVKIIHGYCFKYVTPRNLLKTNGHPEEEPSISIAFSALSEFSDTIISNILDSSKIIFSERQAQSAVRLYTSFVDYVTKHETLSEKDLHELCLTVGFASLGHVRYSPSTTITVAQYIPSVFTKLIGLIPKDGEAPSSHSYIALGVILRRFVYTYDPVLNTMEFESSILEFCKALSTPSFAGRKDIYDNLIKCLNEECKLTNDQIINVFSQLLTTFSNKAIELPNHNCEVVFDNLPSVFSKFMEYLYEI